MSIWPPILYLAITAIACIMAVVHHKTPRINPDSAWGRIIESAVFIALLWLGGFFNPLWGIK